MSSDRIPTHFPPVPRPDMAIAADVAAQLRRLFPDANAASYRCVCDTCGAPWTDCIGMVCADCPTHCATCAAERAEACRDCGEDAYELVADGLCGPCLSVALADRQADAGDGDIHSAQRIAVHRRIGEWRHGYGRPLRQGQNAAGGGGQWLRADFRDRLRGGEQSFQGLFETQHGRSCN